MSRGQVIQIEGLKVNATTLLPLGLLFTNTKAKRDNKTFLSVHYIRVKSWGKRSQGESNKVKLHFYDLSGQQFMTLSPLIAFACNMNTFIVRRFFLQGQKNAFSPKLKVTIPSLADCSGVTISPTFYSHFFVERVSCIPIILSPTIAQILKILRNSEYFYCKP